MSDRLPVADTLNEAFRFGLKRWGTVLRFVWLPMVLSLVMFGGIAAAGLNLDALKQLETLESGGEIPAFNEYFRMPLSSLAVMFTIAGVISWLFFAGFMASVYRLVALGEERPGIFQLRLDGPAFRVFWAHAIVQLINYTILAAAMGIGLSLVGSSFGEMFSSIRDIFQVGLSGVEPTEDQAKALLTPLGGLGLGVLFAFVPMIYVGIKLAPFPPGSAAENRLLLFGAFQMTRGHFWSILGIFLIIIGALILASTIVQLVAAIFETIATLSGGGGLGVIALVAAVVQVIILAAYQIFAYAVQFGVAGVIYRRIKTGA